MRPNMRPTEKTDLKGALRSLTVYLQKSLGVILLALVLAALSAVPVSYTHLTLPTTERV